MPNCPKCGKPVYFAERKTSLGYDWHPQCLKCEMCGKTLNPGRHAEHNGKPYCDLPCYQALFGPEGYGRGGVEAHKAFGNGSAQADTTNDVSEVMGKLKVYNDFHAGSRLNLKHKEVNGTTIIEGVMKIYWGLNNAITVAGGDHIYVGRSTGGFTKQEDLPDQWRKEVLALQDKRGSRMVDSSDSDPEESRSSVERTVTFDSSVEELEIRKHNRVGSLDITQSILEGQSYLEDGLEPMTRERAFTSLDRDGSRPIFRRTSSMKGGRRVSMKRKSQARKSTRFSVLQVENEPTSFTPPKNSATSIRVNSMYRTDDVVKQLLMKYKVLDDPGKFTLSITYDNGRSERLHDHDCPLLNRIKAGPDENVAKLYIVEKDETYTDITAEVAQYLHFQVPELEHFLKMFQEEEERLSKKIREKFKVWKEEIQDVVTELNAQNS